MKRTTLFAMLIALLLPYGLAACSTSGAATDTNVDTAPGQQTTTADPEAATDDASPTPASESITRPDNWTEETHGNDTDPNFGIVFPDNQVNQITITIDPEDWAAMLADMTELYGERGAGEQAGPGRPGENGQPPEGGPGPGGGFGGQGGPPGGGGGDFTSENPMWVESTITFDENTWTHVGVRFKGNSSLMSAWRNGTDKLPLKLDFDQFESEYAEIENQRFYGFKQLSLANGFGDSTYLREAMTYDLLEEAGLVAANTAYYEVYLDYGEGPVSLGLYTMIEVIDDTVVERAFGDDSSNIYEADGQAASLAEGTYTQIETSFQKENNEDEANWGDVQALYEVLHSDERTTDPEAWRAKLEAIFDVNSFLKWLAISAIIQHWDTYGGMNHNYYLYNNPDTGQLTWISWDHNLVLQGEGGMGGGGRGGRGSSTLDKSDVGEDWPLIRYLLDDPTYYQQYLNYLDESVNGVFNPDTLAEKYQQQAAMLEPYVVTETSAESYEQAVQNLIDITYDRAEAVAKFLAGQ